MQESAFGCGQLAAVMRWHAQIEHPVKGEAVIGRRGERGEQVLTGRRCACARRMFYVCAGAKV